MGQEVRIALITGYLGAGKTTLLNHILANDRGIRAAVIVNDIGEVNIDAELIAQGGVVRPEDNSLIPLTNGCICCSLKEDLAAQLRQLAGTGRFDYIVIEASGVCEPIPIAHTVTAICEESADRGLPMRLDNIIAVVDGARMYDEFEGGRALASEAGEDDIEHLLIEQIEFCNTLLINKADLLTSEQMDALEALVRGLQRSAIILRTVQCDAPLEKLLDTGRFDLERALASAAWLSAAHEHDAHGHDHEHSAHLEEFGISTFVYERRQPFTRSKIEALAADWPRAVIRCKGMIWYQEEPGMSYIFEQAGRQIREKQSGPFLAAASAEQQRMILDRFPAVRDHWDPVYGDRRIRLVLIGKDMDRACVEARLDTCLGEAWS